MTNTTLWFNMIGGLSVARPPGMFYDYRNMRSLSPSLKRLLVIKGICRAGPPVYVLWSIVDWLSTDWLCASVFAALTLNYVIVFMLTWTSPALMNGPWRVRPWQTFVLATNAIVLPIMFYRTHGHMPWGFFVATVLCVVSLYVGTAIYLHLNEKLPMSNVFAAQRNTSVSTVSPIVENPS